jgi:transcriptional regulator with XRE-family HTH domain
VFVNIESRKHDMDVLTVQRTETDQGMDRLGRVIAERRQALGLRGDEFAYRIGRAPSWLSRLEHGGQRSLPEPEVLRAIADELGISPADLLEAAGYLDPGDRQTALVNPFPRDDIRHKVVEAMKAVDLHGPEHALWMGHFTMQLRLFRDVARYGVDELDDFGLPGRTVPTGHIGGIDDQAKGA